MSFNYDFVREDGTEVMATYRIIGGGGDYFAYGCWNPGDPLEVEFGKVYGLPAGEELTEEEYQKIEKAIWENPPETELFEEDL